MIGTIRNVLGGMANWFLIVNRLIFNIRLLISSPKSLLYLCQLIRRKRIVFSKKLSASSSLSICFYASGDINIFVPEELSDIRVNQFLREVKYHIEFISHVFSVLIMIAAYGILIWLNYEDCSDIMRGLWNLWGGQIEP